MIVFKRFSKLFLISFSVSLWLVSGATWAAGPEVQATDNLAQVGQDAAKRRLPVLVMFSASYCSYCVVLENEILKPMLLSGDYRDKVIIRKVVIDSGGYIKDFDGKDVLASNISSRYNVGVTPTMLFLDAHGKELSKRLIGVQTLDFYGGDVDAAIDESIKKLRHPATRLSLHTAR